MNTKPITFLLALSLAACGGAGTMPGTRHAQTVNVPSPAPTPRAIPSPTPAPPTAHGIATASFSATDDPTPTAPPNLPISPQSSFSSRLNVSRTVPTTLTFPDPAQIEAVVLQSTPACVNIVSATAIKNGVGHVQIVGLSNAPANCLASVRVNVGQASGLAAVIVP